MRSFALVSTLLIVAVMALGSLAFFQAARMDRLVSRSTADRVRAELAAESGLAAGQVLITALFTNYPDSAVGWTRLTNTELATFYFRTTSTNGFLTNGANAATPASQPVFLFAYPLASGASASQVSAFASSGSVFTNTNTSDGATNLTLSNSINLNADNWIGTPPNGSRPVLRAQWIELLQNPAQAKNTNTNAAGQPINPSIARYAFWAEDESFRVNLNRAGATPRGNNTPGTNPAEIALQGALSGNNTTLAQGITNLQVSLRSNILTPATMALASPTNNYETNRFVVSVHSSALNLSRGGTLRLNLNQVVTNTNDSTAIRDQLGRIVSAITNQSSLTNTNPAQRTAAMPNFGQRFYRLSTNGTTLNDTSVVTGTAGANQLTAIYLQKIAANIRDYIDTDSQPTIVNNDNGFTIRRGTPFAPLNSTNIVGNGLLTSFSEIAAVGKEAVPSLAEYAVRALVTSWVTNATGADFTFRLFHYFEFWNPTTKDIPISALGNNPTLRIMNMYNFNVGAGNLTPATPPVISVGLNQFSGLTGFPANSFTILTTEPPENASSYPFGSGGAIFRSSSSFTTYSGRTTVTNTNGPMLPASLGSNASQPRAGSDDSDYDLWMMVFNNEGILESFSALPTASATLGNVPAPITHLTLNRTNTNVILPSSLRGNDSASRSGEPRSLNEQLSIVRYFPTGQGSVGDRTNRTSFFNTAATNASMGQLGSFVNPTDWVDYSPSITAAAATALYNQRDAALDTVGRLGDVYDPARMRGLASETNLLFRGGARTLKIGQADRWSTQNAYGLWDGSETSLSRNWTSWRLADVFSVTNSTNLPGVININGALRDNGAALQALVFGLIYESSPGGAQATSGRNLNITNFAAAVRNHLAGGNTNNPPSNYRLFWERGQIGELADAANVPLFSSGNSLAGAALNITQDRGREELVRRIMELITTKGNVYTVYAIGQSLNPRNGRPVATHRLKRTFRIDPVFDPALPGDSTFLPAQAGTGDAGDRFRRPSSFLVTILDTSGE